MQNLEQEGGSFMRVEITSDECTGCGYCVDICPDVFGIRDDRVEIRADPVPTVLAGQVQEAIENCPAGAIRIAW